MATGILKVTSESSREGTRRYQPQLQFAQVIAIIVIALNAIVLSGWLLDIQVLRRIVPAFDATTANGAAAFLLLGLLLHLSAAPKRAALEPTTGNKHSLMLGTATTVALIGFATLLQYLLDVDLGIDQLLAIDSSDSAVRIPGRMSVLSAVAVLVLGVVFMLRSLRLAPVLREWLGLSSFVLGYLALMGYVYGAEALYHVGATAIPVQSALCVVLIAGASLLLPPHYGFMRPVVSRGPGGLLVRRLLPVALFVAPAVDFVQTRAVGQMGESSMTLVGLANVALLVVLVWATGKVVQVAHSQRIAAEENAKATRERLLLALQAAGGGAWDLDLAHEEGWWSPEMYRLWNVQPGGPIRLEDSLEIIDPRDRERVMQAVQEAIERAAVYECEFRIRSDGPAERWMASRGRVHYEPSGKPSRLIGITVDISARKAIEISLRQTNEALARSNVELRRFAHVAAHDLQTPLRAIGNYAELVKTSYRDQLDDTGKEWIDRILSSTIHLHALVRDLLMYASIDAEPLEAGAVNMDEVLNRALALLDAEIRESGCAITRTALPAVSGDSAQLVQVLCNLVSNSIKYRSAQTPSVHISAERSDGAWLISVRDNGIGIDPRHTDRIFEVFERLHNAHDYPGTGIGLAICRRVIQHHGGSIWVESQPGVGSTFHFTLPISSMTA
jgi:signal transduction histidine kinase